MSIAKQAANIRRIVGILRGTPQQDHADVVVEELPYQQEGKALWYGEADLGTGAHVSVTMEGKRVYLELDVDDPSDHELTILRDALSARMVTR